MEYRIEAISKIGSDCSVPSFETNADVTDYFRNYIQILKKWQMQQIAIMSTLCLEIINIPYLYLGFKSHPKAYTRSLAF